MGGVGNSVVIGLGQTNGGGGNGVVGSNFDKAIGGARPTATAWVKGWTGCPTPNAGNIGVG